ncbi:MAG: VOC family protein [Chitinophagaceae bacterium]|nr:VOC family protein [Chitinophagaceae bacterium]
MNTRIFVFSLVFLGLVSFHHTSDIKMKPRISIITLGVDDLERSLAFYRDGLGLPTKGIIGQEFERGAVAFFDLRNGLKLAIWPRKNIAWDAGIAEAAPAATELTLGYNVRTREEVDAVIEQARKAGARIARKPHDTFWGGYAGYFQDPDGHLWEVAWNPQMLPED